MPNNPKTLREYARLHKEQIRQSAKKYRDSHKEQIKIYSKRHRELNKEKIRERSKEEYRRNKDKKIEYQRRLTKEYKEKFLKMYGGKCACCGEIMFDFLTIEHKNGQEKISRRTGLVAYRDAVKEYRPDLYEILCWNCNCAKGKLGYCPHRPPKKIKPHRIHKSNKPYNYTKEMDTLGRRYK